jgi:hypothetical protein
MALFSGSKNTTPPSTTKEAWHAPLHKVTPVSKIAAATVVIILPFLGFFLGVQYVAMTTGVTVNF